MEVNKRFQFDHLEFYGAGMSLDENRQFIKTFLTNAGFKQFSIETDALAAGLACCEYEHGFTAILGTGSILLEMNEGRMISRRGGLGPEKGDQGSAFYFGKLLLKSVKDGFFQSEIQQMFGSVVLFLEAFENADPSKLASLAKLTESIDVSLLHRENVKAFIESHILVEKSQIKKLGIVGSYGYHISAILREELQLVNVELNRVFTDPLDGLVTLKIKNTIG